jgi:hypothetical protein
MIKRKLFLASSSELKDDRKEFEIFIGRKNKDWIDQGVFLDLIVWEDFLDALSPTRLQDEYNKDIQACDVFVMLFWTKVGKYTEEEFEKAVGQFKSTNKPFIFTYFKEADPGPGGADPSVAAFQKKLGAMGHFYTRYKNIEDLKYQFDRQLDKLAANGFVELKFDKSELAAPRTSYQATVADDGAIAQGDGTAVGKGGVYIGGQNTGNVNTGNVNTGTQTRVETGGGAYIGGSVQTGGDFVGRDKITQGILPRDLEPLFAPIFAATQQHAPADQKTAATQLVEGLKTEIAKGEQANDSKVGKIIEGLVAKVPEAVGAIVSAFALPLLGGVAGPVTTYVLEKLKGI